MGESVRTDAFSYAPPSGEGKRFVDETRVFSNAQAYEWAYLDTCRENGDTLRNMGQVFPADQVAAKPIPDGWPYAYLEYVRRATVRTMAIREAFRMWRDTGTLPGLDESGSA